MVVERSADCMKIGRSGCVLLEVGRERGEGRMDVVEIGEGWAEVRVSSSVRVWDCQPCWTLTMA